MLDSDDDDPEAVLHPVQREKKKRDPESWKRNMNRKQKKEKRNRGCILTCEHGLGSKICGIRKIDVEELYHVHRKFWRLENAVQERQYIQRFIEISSVCRVRLDKDERKRKQRNYNIECYIQTHSEKVRVCKEALLGVLSIGRSKLELAAKSMLEYDEAMRENRGGAKPTLEGLRNAIIADIQKYRVRERHYARGGTVGRVYLPGELSIKKMFLNFVKTHQHLPVRYTDKKLENLPCKYPYYYYIFKTDFNIGFGTIKTDICSTCERFDNLLLAVKKEEKISVNEGPPGSPMKDYTRKELVAQKVLHRLRYKRFFKELNTWPERTITINFDLMQNQPLPKTEIGEAYYARQIWYYTFGIVIHNPDKKLNKDTVYFYR